MQRCFGAAAVFALVVTVGCGDATTTSSTSPSVATPVLLTVEDLDDTWVAGPATGEADLTDLAAAVREPCPAVVLNPTIAARLAPSAAVQFESADGSARHLMEYVTVGDPDRLALDVEMWIGALDACVAKGARPDVGVMSHERLSLPTLGDQRAAFVQIVSEEPGTGPYWYMRTAIVRVDRVLIVVGLIEVADTATATPSIDDATFEALVGVAVGLVRQ